MERKRQKLKLENSPLVLVLAQLRFSPILKMGGYLPDIQESLRKKGYPRFRAEKIGTSVTLPDGQEVSQTLNRWIFTSQDQTDSVVLSENFVVLETSQYSVFEEFLDKFKVVADVVNEISSLKLTERIGLRYIDLIRGCEGMPSRSYLGASMRGLEVADLEGINDLLTSSLSQCNTPYGRLVVQAVDCKDGRILPPDLENSGLKFQISLEKGEVVTFLDIDHYSPIESAYHSAEIAERMWQLHDYTDLAFRTAVTRESIEYWRK